MFHSWLCAYIVPAAFSPYATSPSSELPRVNVLGHPFLCQVWNVNRIIYQFAVAFLIFGAQIFLVEEGKVFPSTSLVFQRRRLSLHLLAALRCWHDLGWKALRLNCLVLLFALLLTKYVSKLVFSGDLNKYFMKTSMRCHHGNLQKLAAYKRIILL